MYIFNSQKSVGLEVPLSILTPLACFCGMWLYHRDQISKNVFFLLFFSKTPWPLTSWVPDYLRFMPLIVNDAAPYAISPPARTIWDSSINSRTKMCSLAHGDWPKAIIAFQTLACSSPCCYLFAHLFIHAFVYLFLSYRLPCEPHWQAF